MADPSREAASPDPLVWLREHSYPDAVLVTSACPPRLLPDDREEHRLALAARLRTLLESQASQAAEIARLREEPEHLVRSTISFCRIALRRHQRQTEARILDEDEEWVVANVFAAARRP